MNKAKAYFQVQRKLESVFLWSVTTCGLLLALLAWGAILLPLPKASAANTTFIVRAQTTHGDGRCANHPQVAGDDEIVWMSHVLPSPPVLFLTPSKLK